LAVKLAMEHPEWTGKQILATAGYKGWTLEKPGRVLSTPTARAHEAELRVQFRDKLAKEFTLDDAVTGLASLAKSGKNEFARLNAINDCLEHMGVKDPAAKQQVLVLVLQSLAPILEKYVPEARRGEFMADLEAV
jgi:hypothetical protein